MVRYSNTSRKYTARGLISSERALKIMGIDLRNHSFDGLGPEISWVKGCPGPLGGGWGLGQSGVPRSPGGECFAPSGPMFQGFPSRYRHGVVTIGKSVENHYLGHSLLVREGVRSTLLSREHMEIYEKSSKINFSDFLKFIRDHPRALRNTPGHV